MTLSSPLFAVLAMVPVVATMLLGIQLKPEYVQEVVRRPRALLAGFAGQFLLLPLVAAVFFYTYPAPASFKWSWFILAAVPGGAMSNMVAFLGRGRLSLSVVLTACSMLAGIVTIPFWVNVGMRLSGDEATRALPIASMVMGSFAVLVVPLALGIAIGIWNRRLAERLRRPTRLTMLVLLIVGAAAYTVQRWEFIAADFDRVVFAGAALFHVVVVLGAWSLGRGLGLDRSDSFTIGIESGVQNVVIAVLVIELLGRGDLVPLIGYYIMFVVLFSLLWVRLLGGAPSSSLADASLAGG